jgi:hypothetical protein
LKTFAKKLKGCHKDIETARVVAAHYISVVEKAAKHNVVHANKVNRLKGQLSRYVFAPAAEAPDSVVPTTPDIIPDIPADTEAVVPPEESSESK